MKMWKKFLLYGMTIVQLSWVSAIAVFAASEQEEVELPQYTYTVTFSAGNQGKFLSDPEAILVEGNPAALVELQEDRAVVSNLKSGDRILVSIANLVDVADKYYVKGIRVSGRDNDTVTAPVFTVTEDADYVVAYGVKGNQVKYTVHYQDSNGNTLRKSEEFYGNVGDQPVVAYRYVEGWAPKSIGLTKILTEEEIKNVFSFVYEPVPKDVHHVTEREEVRLKTVTQVIGGTTVIADGADAPGADDEGTEGAETGSGVSQNTGSGVAAENETEQRADLAGSAASKSGEDFLTEALDEAASAESSDGAADVPAMASDSFQLSGWVWAGITAAVLAAVAAVCVVAVKLKKHDL